MRREEGIERRPFALRRFRQVRGVQCCVNALRARPPVAFDCFEEGGRAIAFSVIARTTFDSIGAAGSRDRYRFILSSHHGSQSLTVMPDVDRDDRMAAACGASSARVFSSRCGRDALGVRMWTELLLWKRTRSIAHTRVKHCSKTGVHANTRVRLLDAGQGSPGPSADNAHSRPRIDRLRGHEHHSTSVSPRGIPAARGHTSPAMGAV